MNNPVLQVVALIEKKRIHPNKAPLKILL